VQRRIEALAAANRLLARDVVRRRAVEVSLRQSEQRAHRLLKQSEQRQIRLRLLSHQVLQAQENERRRISRELHDDISQLLVGIDVHLANFTKAAVLTPGGIRRSLSPLRRMVAESVGIVHRFARDLRPAMLDDLGLIPALCFYIEHLPASQRRRIKFVPFAGVEALGSDKRMVFYRVVQEALANAARHARHRRVTVTMDKTSDGVRLQIADNGHGFKVGPVSSGKWNDRLGLIGMRERVEMVGGRFGIRSILGTGTTVRAEIPFGP
jgi:signal transduction histidine kinase